MDIAYDEKQRKAHDEAACHPGNAARYGVSVLAPDRTSPLRGKSIAFLGSSVTVGCFSMGQTCADFLARKDGVLALKEAVSGTTLTADAHDGSSYVERMRTIPPSTHLDAFVCQLSTNDAWQQKAMGSVAAEGPYDVTTVAGAI